MSDVRTKSSVRKENKQIRSRNETENKISNDQKKEFLHADFIERLIIEASTSKRQRRRGSVTSSNHSYDIDRILEDENNDWFFERILEKFENIRSKKTHRHVTPLSNDFYNDDDDEMPRGVERIVERRYYVKKPRSTLKRDQLTSTSDLTVFGRKNRQYSAVSSATAATSICSQCLASTPTYVDNLRDQSDTLRHEINDLKNEIEQLQTSQQEFFQQLRTHFQVKPGSTTTATASTNIVQTTIPSLPSSTQTSLPVPLPTGKKVRSISTESQASSASSTSPPSSEQTTTTEETTAKPNPAPPSNPVAPKSVISEFMATKNPTIVPTSSNYTYTSSEQSSIAPTPTARKQVDSKPSSIVATAPVSQSIIISKPPLIVPTPPASEQVSSKPPSIAPTPPLNGQINSKPSSIAPTPLLNEQINSKPPSIAPTPPVFGSINPNLQTTGNIGSKPSSIAPTPPLTEFTASRNPVIVPTPPVTEFTATKNPVIVPAPPTAVSLGPVNSRTSSIAPTPPIAPPFLSSGRIPIYENELAHRRVLSPRSQIVASSASNQDSSDTSSGSISPELIESKPPKIPKDPLPTLRANELNDLVQYSSKLERSGFPSSVNPVITNPNTSSTFWDSVDQYINNSRSTNINIGLPPMARPNNRNRLVLNNNTTKRLDKYDLEIKPQEFIESSAPLLMPPLDILS